MKQEAKKPRVQFMNYLNILACFGVICLHCSNVVFLPSDSLAWHVGVIGQSLFSFAVPIFFMISGANLLSYHERYSTKTFFKKRFRKTFGALFLGSMLIYLGDCFIPQLFGHLYHPFSLCDFGLAFFTNNILTIYWFFYVILAIYILTPLLCSLRHSKRQLQYAISLLFILASVFPLVNNYTSVVSFLSSLFGGQILLGGVMYFLLGYYLQNYAKQPKRSFCFLSFFACVVLMVVFTYAINFDAVQVANAKIIPYNGYWANAFSILAAIASPSLFMLFKSFEPFFQAQKWKSGIQELSSASLGVYLIHFPIIEFTSYIYPHPPTFDLTIGPFLYYAISMAIVFTAQILYRKTKAILHSLKTYHRNGNRPISG